MSTETNESENETPAVIDETPHEEPVEPQGKEDYTMGMLCHLVTFLGYVGVPFGNIVGPLVIWLMKKDQDAFVDETGKEVLNFQISVTIYAIVCGLLFLVFIGIILLPILLIATVVYTIIGAMKANEGQVYRYPFTIRFIK